MRSLLCIVKNQISRLRNECQKNLQKVGDIVGDDMLLLLLLLKESVLRKT